MSEGEKKVVAGRCPIPPIAEAASEKDEDGDDDEDEEEEDAGEVVGAGRNKSRQA